MPPIKPCPYCEKHSGTVCQRKDYMGNPAGIMCDDCWATSGLNPDAKRDNIWAREIFHAMIEHGTDMDDFDDYWREVDLGMTSRGESRLQVEKLRAETASSVQKYLNEHQARRGHHPLHFLEPSGRRRKDHKEKK